MPDSPGRIKSNIITCKIVVIGRLMPWLQLNTLWWRDSFPFYTNGVEQLIPAL